MASGVSRAKRIGAVPTDLIVGSIPMRTLGRTGERVSAIGLGGFHLGKPDLREAESIRIIRTAIDAGVKDRKSTRLNSSHSQNSYAVFCLKKKKKNRYDDHKLDSLTSTHRYCEVI